MNHGTIVWHDLMTTDPAGARAFYTKLLGWEVVEFAIYEGPYTLFKQGDRLVAGLVTLDRDASPPAYWVSFVSVPNVEETVKRARLLDAKTVFGLIVAEAGRWDVIEDPQGGHIVPFEGAPSLNALPGDEGMPPVGAFCWDELCSADPAASVDFYGKLFGWRPESREMDNADIYTILYADQIEVGGAMKAQGPQKTSWLSYVHVDDVDALARRASELGGQVHAEPTDISNIGRIAVIGDPTGAVFGLYKPL